jgi:hypothetical protein
VALNVNVVREAIAESIRGVGGVYAYSYPPDTAQPPFAYVDMPQSIDYDLSFGRGADRMTIQVHVGVTRSMDAAAADAIGELAATSGPNSLKVAIESGQFGTNIRVARAEFAQIALNDATYAGLVLTLDWAG